MGLYGLVGWGFEFACARFAFSEIQPGTETLNSANLLLFAITAIGILTAGLYVSLYRAVYKKLQRVRVLKQCG